jgi:hypothetical protein
MAIRLFTDKRGARWMVWDVRPSSSYMRLAGAEYPAEFYAAGWLSFYTLRGTEHRLLSPIPSDWETRPTAELIELLELAAPRLSPSWLAPPPAAAAEPRDVGIVRAFVHPAGRPWTAHLTTPEAGGPPVLRFMSGDRSVDLGDWPPEWADLPDASLVDLLRRVPRTGPPAGNDTPRRRWNDPPP